MKPIRSDAAIPDRECDVILKGGITSGVVYPLAIAELAQTYRLKNIGGTSAGAIAAGLAAAAELGRGTPGGGFESLRALPEFMGRGLTSLFQPSRETRPAFRVLLAWLRSGPGKPVRFKKLSFFKRLLLLLPRIVGSHWAAFVAGALLGVALFQFFVDWPASRLVPTRAVPFRVVWALLWGAIVAGAVFLVQAVRAIQGNAFGLCTGMTAHGSREPALTLWLADLLDRTAGKTDGPLTFGDLWGSGTPEEMRAKEHDPRLRRINLEVMTTNLTHGWPVRLPTSSRQFFFDPEELRAFFPERIVQWMLDHPAVPGEEDEPWLVESIVRESRFRPLPDAANLPVVVALRMSLSFPVLISAVPLYGVDWSRKSRQEARAAKRAPELDRCWFSDGGISSNFPIHFFDGLLPTRPTFGINLRPFHAERPKDEHDESRNVWFPTKTGEAVLPIWTPIESLAGFLGTIVRTMQSWNDNTQMRLPGYRDRVAHVFLSEEEGGMNLSMPEERVLALTRRGEAAGRALQDLDWDGHRWTRYRTAMSQLQDKLERMEEVYTSEFEGFLAAYDSMKGRYQRPKAWKDYALQATADLFRTVRAWRQDPNGYRLDDETSPKPEPDLRITPKR